ncbi:MAG: gamma-glutamyltransferase [Methylobacterium sp.]|jgi:gamma-glutamyltranspeptidase/glutathione hydrolase|nr:gamma-glutamyltransferase [Methylobacterium sp.]
MRSKTVFAGLVLALGSAGLATAQQAPPSAAPPIIAQNARLLPVLAQNGMVSSQERLASAIGVDVLKRGGNAVDAAVAVGFALAVTLPRAGNLGGGGFMLVHLARTGETVAIDYREIAPAASTPTMFLGANGEPDPQKSRDSGLSVGVPGTVRGMALALEKYGSGKFTLAQLIEPSVKLAREGIPVAEDLADSLPGAMGRMSRFPSSMAIFAKDGKALPRGSMLVQAELANTLEAIRQQGPDAFYKGRIAEQIVAAVRETGGIMTLEDMANYKAVIRPAVTGRYRGYTLASMPPPSSGGVHLVQILNILEGYDLKAMGAGSAASLHALAEAMKPAYADRATFLGDPDRVKVPVKGLTSKAYAEKQRAKIDLSKASKADDIKAGDPLPHESDQTTHYSVVDSEGNAVANTYTLNFSYGMGLVAAGTGVLLNNEMDDFSAKPGAQNAYGLVGSDANSVHPGARPLSSMTPTIVFRDGKPFMVTGSPGGSRIISTTLQVITNVIDFDMNLAEAVAAPRIHHQWKPDALLVEPGLSPDTLKLLVDRGQTVRPGAVSGSANSILLQGGWLQGAADTRQRGTAAIGH